MYSVKTTVLALCLVLMLIGIASAETIYVPTNYAKIQWAVNNASAGDTIIVLPGTYHENVFINKPLTLEAETPHTATIVAADNLESAIEISSSNVVVKGFNITGEGITAFCFLAPIGCNNVKIEDNNIYNCLCDEVYNGISVYGNNSYIKNNNIYNCSGDGIFIYGNNSYIKNNNIYNCSGDGIDLCGSNSYILNNYVYHCSYSGIEIYGNSNNSYIKNNNIYNCLGDGIEIYGNSNNSYIKNNNIYNCLWSGIDLCGSNSYILNNYVYHCSYSGINIHGNTSYIKSNNIYSCSNDGIDLWSNSYIVSNYIYHCRRAIWIYGNNNTIYLNKIVDCLIPVDTYLSDTNHWNSTEKLTYVYNDKTFTNYLGNYWCNYKGVDTNGDGIGDTPYVINSNNIDYYPLISPNISLATPTPNPHTNPHSHSTRINNTKTINNNSISRQHVYTGRLPHSEQRAGSKSLHQLSKHFNLCQLQGIQCIPDRIFDTRKWYLYLHWNKPDYVKPLKH